MHVSDCSRRLRRCRWTKPQSMLYYCIVSMNSGHSPAQTVAVLGPVTLTHFMAAGVSALNFVDET